MFELFRRTTAEPDEILRHYFSVLSGEEKAGYLENKSDLDRRLKACRKIMRKCRLCERRCGVDREKKAGACGVREPRISSYFLHTGEEPELVPSFTIFFSGCNLECVFCQNHDISRHPGSGRVLAPEKVADLISNTAARNVNWVGGDPIPNIGFILEVLNISGTSIPQVFNSNMYLTEDGLGLLDGIVDLYLTDLKYGNNECGRRLSRVERYFDVVSRNHKTVNRDTEMIIRHLMLPGHYECCTVPVIMWIVENLDVSRVKLNLMAQYHPDHNARDYEELCQPLDLRYWSRARDLAAEYGIPLTN